MNLVTIVRLSFGGPGSGCKGPNCGRPKEEHVAPGEWSSGSGELRKEGEFRYGDEDDLIKLAKEKIKSGLEVGLDYDMGGSFHEPDVEYMLKWRTPGYDSDATQDTPEDRAKYQLQQLQNVIDEAQDKFADAFDYSKDSERRW